MLKQIFNFFDKFEDHVRRWLSRRPILYAFIGGTGIVLFWRGIWHLNDFLVAVNNDEYVSGYPWWDGPLSLALGTVMLLATGILVSNFIGNEVIISGIKGEKKLIEKTESDVHSEVEQMHELAQNIEQINKRLEKIEKIK